MRHHTRILDAKSYGSLAVPLDVPPLDNWERMVSLIFAVNLS